MTQRNRAYCVIKKWINALSCSAKGIQAAIKYEAAFRQELVLLFITLIVVVIGSFSAWQRFALIGSVLLLLIVELLNSAIEAVVDRVGKEHHELAGRAKDLGSAAVFVTLIGVMMIWITVFCCR